MVYTFTEQPIFNFNYGCVVLFQEMVYVTVETASAGKVGPEMLVRFGLGLNIPNIATKH